MKCICIAKWISPFLLLSIHFRMHSFGRTQTWIALRLPTNKNAMMLQYFVWMCVKRRLILIFNFSRCHYFWLADWNKRNVERKYQMHDIYLLLLLSLLLKTSVLICNIVWQTKIHPICVIRLSCHYRIPFAFVDLQIHSMCRHGVLDFLSVSMFT